MALIDKINKILQGERLDGDGASEDILNRPITDLVNVLESGKDSNIKVQITTIDVDSAEFEGSVTDGDFVYLDDSSGLFTKVDETHLVNALGVADVTNLLIYLSGPTVISGKSFTPGKFVALNQVTAGDVVEEDDPDASQYLVGVAISSDTILLSTAIGGAGAGTPDATDKAHYELTNNGEDASWSPVRVNPSTLNEDYTVPTGANGSVTGPFEIADTVVLTVSDGSTFVIN